MVKEREGKVEGTLHWKRSIPFLYTFSQQVSMWNAGATWHFRVLVYVNAYHGAMNPWFGADGPDGEARIRA
jgi:hypothetical protein